MTPTLFRFLFLGLPLCVCIKAAAENPASIFEYDVAGNLVATVDMTNRRHVNSYDGLNRMVRVTNALNGSTQLRYDANDQLIEIVDPKGTRTSYTRNGFGETVLIDSGDTGKTTNSYDMNGNVASRTDAKGQLVSFQYDMLDRPTQITYPDGNMVKFQYDTGPFSIGRLVKVMEAIGSTQYDYDQYGHILVDSRIISGASFRTAYRYDGSGLPSGLTYPSGRQVDYVRDATGRITSITTTADGVSETVVLNIQYQPFGGIRSMTFGNNQSYTRAYDTVGRISSYTLNEKTQMLDYDNGSRINSIKEAVLPLNDMMIQYDPLDRITAQTKAFSSIAVSYDSAGNRTQTVNGSTVTNYSIQQNSNRIAAINGAQSVAYAADLDGNTTDNGNAKFSYNPNGQMVSSTTKYGTVEYRLNFLGQRVQKLAPTLSTTYHYDLSGNLIAESTANSTMEYIYLGRIPVAVFK